MKYRKLRIAWSAGCAIACLMLILLWVRSYWKWDLATVAMQPKGAGMGVQSARGQMMAHRAEKDQFSGLESFDIKPGWSGPGWYTVSSLGFYIEHSSARALATIPYWFAVLLTGLITTAPWIAWSPRFSLRTLLISTTLVAVGLGLIVYEIRK